MVPLALDTETLLFRDGYRTPELVCLSGYGPGVAPFVVDLGGSEQVLEVALQGHMTAHYAAYDFSVLANQYPWHQGAIIKAYEENRITCTVIRQQLLDIAAGDFSYHKKIDGYDLATLLRRLTGRTLDKGMQLEYWKLQGVPIDQWPELAREYPREDARACGDIWTVQEVNAGPFLEDQYRQARSDFWIRMMHSWGIHTDLAGVEAFARKTQASYDLIAQDLRSIGLLRPDTWTRKRNGSVEHKPGARNETLAKAMIRTAYEKLGKPCPMTEGGKGLIKNPQPAIDKVACQESGDPILIQYSKLSTLKAVLSKDVPLLRQGIHTPIHSRFWVLVESGRTSSSGAEGGGGNLQNLRRLPGVRECFVPRPGCVFGNADYGQLELFTLAEVCYQILGYSNLGEMLNAKIDPHMMIAADISGEPYECLKHDHKTLDHETERWKQVDNWRQTGKVCNFGFPGGLGAASLVWFALEQYDVRIVEDQEADIARGILPGAKQLKRIWLNRFPEMRMYFRWIDQQVKANPPMIKHLYSNRYRGGMGYTDACNSYFQGLGADVAKAAGWEIMKAQFGFGPGGTSNPLWGFRTVLFVHDDFMIEGPEHRAHEAVIELSRIMVEASRPWLPHMRAIDAEPLLTRRYSKKAKPIWKDDRLIPWDQAA